MHMHIYMYANIYTHVDICIIMNRDRDTEREKSDLSTIYYGFLMLSFYLILYPEYFLIA